MRWREIELGRYTNRMIRLLAMIRCRFSSDAVSDLDIALVSKIASRQLTQYKLERGLHVQLVFPPALLLQLDPPQWRTARH